MTESCRCRLAVSRNAWRPWNAKAKTRAARQERAKTAKERIKVAKARARQTARTRTRKET